MFIAATFFAAALIAVTDGSHPAALPRSLAQSPKSASAMTARLLQAAAALRRAAVRMG